MASIVSAIDAGEPVTGGASGSSGRSRVDGSRATSRQALRSIPAGSRPTSRAIASISALRVANPSGELPYQSNQVF
jgi:hypothetical protein